MVEHQVVVESYLAVPQGLGGSSHPVLASGNPDYKNLAAEPQVLGGSYCRVHASGNTDYKNPTVELQVLMVVEW